MSSRGQRDYWTRNWEGSRYSLADKLAGDRWISVSGSPLLPVIRETFPPGARILEAGCGMGQWVIHLADLGYRTVGVDFAVTTLREVARARPGHRWVGGDLTSLPFRDGAFDGVLSWGVVEHFEEGPGEPLREARRVLKPGGRMLVTVPCRSWLLRAVELLAWPLERLAGWNGLRRLLGLRRVERRFYQYEFTPGRFQAHLRSAGFRILHLEPTGHDKGFADPLNRLLRIPTRRKTWFHRGSGDRWEGLTPLAGRICAGLRRISPWFTPDMMFLLVERS